MGCINPDGTLTESAKKVLVGLQTPARDSDVAALAGLPLYRVRSSLRELADAGLVAEAEGWYSLNDSGRAKL